LDFEIVSRILGGKVALNKKARKNFLASNL
jgi:hypothetical protein